MPLKDQPRIRKALLAGVVALTLTGTGAAFALSADDPPSPFPSERAQENRQDKQEKPARPDKSQRAQQVHSESVAKKADGTFETQLNQRGTVEAVSDKAITVRSEDGYSQAYTVDAETKVTQAPSQSADTSERKDDDGKRLKPSDGTISDIAVGDNVRIAGVKNGDTVTAERIIEGAGDGPGLGLGRGNGKGFGKGHSK
ncbi:hypothetical protein CXX84_16280 [Arthrobacter sp. AFG7.2]|uniref:DUF5666 domain-containing protein n=1 Tax=Arthrobacter sp. AFG7.2 TaxID=1688693 RepID=UPI000C9E95B9|nr:DUF5666 domain-containing protein [Arthrobacter sp. AFG7.2]PNI07391.1 hypothetical protein CXX84_16280 [Arthrobacter sp. AFG7.2]